MPKRHLNIVITLIFVGIICTFYYFDPSQFNFFPVCYFKAFTGFDCPGCGGQRALHDLLHLHIYEAIDHNLLFVAGSPILTFAGFNAFFADRKYFFTNKTLWVICLVVLLFWVARNIPIAELVWLRAA